MHHGVAAGKKDQATRRHRDTAPLEDRPARAIRRACLGRIAIGDLPFDRSAVQIVRRQLLPWRTYDFWLQPVTGVVTRVGNIHPLRV
jgi:hypothetical protein